MWGCEHCVLDRERAPRQPRPIADDPLVGVEDDAEGAVAGGVAADLPAAVDAGGDDAGQLVRVDQEVPARVRVVRERLLEGRALDAAVAEELETVEPEQVVTEARTGRPPLDLLELALLRP